MGSTSATERTGDGASLSTNGRTHRQNVRQPDLFESVIFRVIYSAKVQVIDLHTIEWCLNNIRRHTDLTLTLCTMDVDMIYLDALSILCMHRV